MKVAVVGGGWAGLAAAVELTDRGFDTTLFEAGRVFGGRARSVEIDGRTLDNGQHILLGAYRDTQALMRRVGADPARCFRRLPLQVSDGTGFRLALPKVPAPFNVAFGLLAAQAVGLREKLATAYWMQGVKWRKFRLAEDCSVAAWLDAAGQTGRLRQHLWEPLCLAALNTPAERASAQLFANVLRDSLGSPRRSDTDLLLPCVPFGELLPEPASRWLEKNGTSLRAGRRIRRIEYTERRIGLDEAMFDAVVLAVAPQHLAALDARLGVAFDYEPIATVYLQYAAGIALPFPLQHRPGRHGQWVVDRGQGMLACVLSGHGDWEALTDDALAAALNAELGLNAAPTWHRVIREKRATFSCRPRQLRPGCETWHPRLFLAGDYTWSDYPATLEGAVRSGLRAARRVTDVLAGG